MMKPFKALKFLISPNKHLKPSDKNSKTSIKSPENSNSQTLPSPEFIKSSNKHHQPSKTQDFHNLNNNSKEKEPLKLPDQIPLINLDNQTNYEENFTLLISSLKEITRNNEILRENQKDLMQLCELRFNNIDILLKSIALKNKTLKKKYEEVCFATSLDTLSLTNKIYSGIETQKNQSILTKLEELNQFFSEEIKKKMLKQQKPIKKIETNQNLLFNLSEKNTSLKKNKKNLSQSIQTLDLNLKKKFLISLQDKIKMRKEITITENCEDSCEINNSPKIKLVQSEKILQNGLFSKHKELKPDDVQIFLKSEPNELPRPSSLKNESKENPLEDEKNEKKHLFLPEQEKKIITTLLKNEYHDNIETENAFFLRGDYGKEHQVKFIINANWWRSWIHYITSDVKIYPKEIINKNLIQEDFFCKDLALNRRLKLRDNLLEHHDYEAVSKQVFRYLKKWYGVDYEIVRFLKKDPIDEDRVFLDLYPEKNSLTKSSLFLSKNPRLRNHSQEDKSAFQTGQSITLNTLNDNPNASREIDRKFFSQIPSSRNKSFGQNLEKGKEYHQNSENCKIY